MRLNRYAAGKTLTFRLFALFSCIFLWQCSYFSATPPQDRRFDRPAAPSAMQYPDLRRATAPNAVESGRPTPYGHGVSGESTRSANPAYDRTGVNEDPFFDRKLPSSAGGTYMHEPAALN